MLIVKTIYDAYVPKFRFHGISPHFRDCLFACLPIYLPIYQFCVNSSFSSY